MAKWAVLYTSVTGNTKKIAEAIAEQADADIFRVQDAPEDLSQYEVVALGYWLRLGRPDPLMLKFMHGVHDANVLFFQTHGTDPMSEHAITSFARAGQALGPNCEIVGTFGCRGKINPKMLEKRKNADPNDPHGGKKGQERWKLASTHPDEQDVADAKDFVVRMQRKIVMKQKFLAKKAAEMAVRKQTI